MIYLIGGCAKAGKTYLAKRILKEKGISYFSTDYMMVAIGKGNPNLNINIDDDDFIVAKNIQPYLETMIEAMVYNKIDYLIEGVHLLPDLVKKLTTKYPNEIKCCYVGFTTIPVEEKVQELNVYKRSIENCWYKSFNDEQMKQLIHYLIKFSQIIKKDCEQLSLPYFDIQNIVFDSNSILDLFFNHK